MSTEVESHATVPPPTNGVSDLGTVKVLGKPLSLPPRARRSSSISSGSALGATKKALQDTGLPHGLHDAPVLSSSDDEATPHLQLRRAITEYRHSLTLSELSFLKELISSGNETNIQSALDTLKDDILFSPPSPESKVIQKVVEEKGSNTTTSTTLIPAVPIPQIDAGHHLTNPNTTMDSSQLHVVTPKTQLISDSGEDSVTLLERYKNSLQDKDHHHHQLHLNSAYDLDKPIQLVNRTTSFGSEARGAHIEKRMASMVHGNLWKAHESGISLHTIPRSTRQQSGVVINNNITMMDDRPELLKRSNSAMSTSTMDLVEHGGPMACAMLDNIFRTYSPPRLVFFDRKAIATDVPVHDNISHAVPPATTGRYHRSHSRSDSIASTSSVGSSHFDWPPSNFETIFRARISALQQQHQQHQYSRSPSMGKRLLQSGEMDSPTRLQNLPPIHHMRRNSSSARSISSIPSLHRASLIRSHSMASSIMSADHQQAISEMDGMTNSIYNLPPRGHRRLDSDRSSVGSFPTLRRAAALRANSVVSSVVPLDQVKDDEFADFAKRWLTGDVAVNPSNSVPKVYDAPVNPKIPMDKRPSKSITLQPQIIMKDTSDGSDDGIELELQMLDLARTKMRSHLDSSCDESIVSRSSINSYESNRHMYTRSLVDRMSSTGERSTSISYPFWTPSTAKDSDSIHPLNETIEIPVESKSWDMHSEGDAEHYNAWDVLVDEYSIGYGFRDLPFQILGTSADDGSAKPHVMSPPLMESLSYFFPESVANENWWLKYSLIRDGASMYTMLQRIRGSTHTLIAIETVDGEVFGSFTSKPWRKSLKFFGTGESFLWRMRKTRKTPCQSVIDQAQLESEIEVYPWTGCNNCVQICNSQHLIVGGGAALEDRSDGVIISDHQAEDGKEYGLGLVIEGRSMLYGTSCQSATFNNAPLSSDHADGSPFEIANLEVWTFSPANSVELAERLELGSLFLESNTLSKQ